MAEQKSSDNSGNIESYFTAVGLVNGKLIQDEEGHWQIITSSQKYRATFKSWQNQLEQKIKPGTLQCFRVYPRYNYKTGQLNFQIVRVFKTREQESIFTLQGCWALNPKQKDTPCLVIHRNEKRNESDRATCLYLPLIWPNAPTPDQRFWHIRAQLEAHQLMATHVEGPFPTPLTWEQRQTLGIPFRKPTSRPNNHKQQNQDLQAQAIPTLSVTEIQKMAMTTKIQVACKISAVPQSRTVNGQVEFFLGEGDRILTVRVKPKVFKKLTDHQFDSWVAAISGDLGPATETGFEVINPGIQVFEKKPKEKKTESPQETIESHSLRKAGNEKQVAKLQEKDGTKKQNNGKENQNNQTNQKKNPTRKQRLTDGIRFG